MPMPLLAKHGTAPSWSRTGREYDPLAARHHRQAPLLPRGNCPGGHPRIALAWPGVLRILVARPRRDRYELLLVIVHFVIERWHRAIG